MAILVVNRENSARALLSKYPCPESGQGVYRWYHSAFKTCAKFHVRADVAYVVIESLLTRPVKAVELQRSMNKAYGGSPADHIPLPKPDPYDPAKLAVAKSKLTFDLTSKWLIENSPMPVNITPGRYLDLIYPGKKVVVINRYKSKGGFIYEDPAGDKEMTAFANGKTPDENGKAGAWFCANPVNGEWLDGSIRSEANLTEFGYAMMESDVAPAKQWCAMLIQETLAILSLVWTGSGSVYALIRIKGNEQERVQGGVGQASQAIFQSGIRREGFETSSADQIAWNQT